MNIRKPSDYSALFSKLDELMVAQFPQMNLYCEIGRLVSSKAEKGAAVVASEHLRAMNLGWTQNVAILERCSSNEERAWYIRAVLRFGWKKAKLLEAIESQTWLYSSLDEQMISCYTEEKEVTQESESDEKDTLCVSRQYLPQPNGRVRDEGLGQKNWACFTVSYRVGGNQPGGDRQPALSSGTAQAGGAWDILRRAHGAAAYEAGLRRIRPADRHGQCEPQEYTAHLRRRLRRQAVPPDGLHRPSTRCCRPVVHRRF